MRFEKLGVWKRACRLSSDIYKQTKLVRDFGFRDQITRSALSVASNIAEGEERNSLKENIRFLYCAKGSLAELLTQIYIGMDVGYIHKESGREAIVESKQIAAMLSRLIQVKQEQLRRTER
ncbi:four helix bundle protein [Vibrio agarivorans]|uniref:Four helix bundle protein n=1 Tax=Vibrio agarivorans TaxID=153622 RepID=A0ABT7XW35_9VIBR|nr:four helix bundle protein [Vibrio agarivorans]MDN2479984.1 four helix bundle protein [Vibrio agarivorans]